MPQQQFLIEEFAGGRARIGQFVKEKKKQLCAHAHKSKLGKITAKYE